MRTAALPLTILLLVLASWPQAQGTTAATPITFVSAQGRRAIPTTLVSGQEFIALDDVANLFQVMVREDAQAGGITITYKGRSVVMSTDQPMASVNGRVVSLPSAAVRSGRRWLVPLDFLPRALAPIYEARIELRRPSRLLLLGDVRVPRVTTRIDALGPPTRATVEIAPATPVAVVVESDRILLRLDADALDLALPATGGGLIAQMRAGDQPTSLTIVLSPRSGTAHAVPTTTDNVTRVAVDVSAQGQTDTLPPPAAPQPPAAGPPPPDVPLVPAAPRSAVQTIVIDPGHGGDEAGAKGPKGTLEKTVALDVARRVKTLLETRLGIRVVMTRDDDRAVSLDTRSAIANNSKADLFLSLHLNAALAATVAGAEVYFLRLDKEGEEARRSAAADEITVSVLNGGTRAIEVIRWDLAQARHIMASDALAGMIEAELRKHVPMGSRPRQQAPLRVLAGVNMPAVLVEMAYLTNPEQEQFTRSADFQASLAQALFDAVVAFRTSLDEPREQ